MQNRTKRLVGNARQRNFVARNKPSKFDPLARNTNKYSNYMLSQARIEKALLQMSTNTAGRQALTLLCRTLEGIRFVEQMNKNEETHAFLERLSKTKKGREILISGNISLLKRLLKEGN